MSYIYNPITINPLTSTTSTSYTLASSGSSNSWVTISDGSSNLSPNTLQVKGTAEFENDANFQGEVKIQGKSLRESLDRIEARLAILHPNEELEEKWDQLRGLRQMYMELEAEIIEKEKMWSILKK